MIMKRQQLRMHAQLQCRRRRGHGAGHGAQRACDGRPVA
eukprot:SAG22_NODE_1087_length_5605_cov_7.128224_5_plen_38_part_01